MCCLGMFMSWPMSELTASPVSELHAKALRELPFGFRDTDSVCVLEPPKFDGDIGCWLQFRDDRLINFDRRQWEDDLRTCIAGTELITISVRGE
jgi:hypothetical protein